MFEAKDLIGQAIKRHGNNIAVACSFGKDRTDFMVAFGCLISFPLFIIIELFHLIRHTKFGEILYSFYEGKKK